MKNRACGILFAPRPSCRRTLDTANLLKDALQLGATIISVRRPAADGASPSDEPVVLSFTDSNSAAHTASCGALISTAAPTLSGLSWLGLDAEEAAVFSTVEARQIATVATSFDPPFPFGIYFFGGNLTNEQAAEFLASSGEPGEEEQSPLAAIMGGMGSFGGGSVDAETGKPRFDGTPLMGYMCVHSLLASHLLRSCVLPPAGPHFPVVNGKYVQQLASCLHVAGWLVATQQPTLPSLSLSILPLSSSPTAGSALRRPRPRAASQRRRQAPTHPHQLPAPPPLSATCSQTWWSRSHHPHCRSTPRGTGARRRRHTLATSLQESASHRFGTFRCVRAAAGRIGRLHAPTMQSIQYGAVVSPCGT